MQTYYKSPIGLIEIQYNTHYITALSFVKDSDYSFLHKESALILELYKQLDEYFQCTRKIFAIPYLLEGTEFQKKVWEELATIPYGSTKSYKEIAIAIAKPKAARAIGMANNKNPLALIIPCHRVIGSNGKLVGYAGGIGIKEKLLYLEGNNFIC